MTISLADEWQDDDDATLEPDAPQNANWPVTVPENIFPVPAGRYNYTISGGKIFPAIAKFNLWFMRNGTVHEVFSDQDGAMLSPLTKDRAVSVLEEFASDTGKRIARFEIQEVEGKKFPKWRTSTMPTGSMEIMMQSNVARRHLPEIRQLLACPVIIEGADRSCQTLAKGFHSHGGGTYITHGEKPPEVPLAAAVEALLSIHGDFAFSSKSDHARAIAVMLSPALKMGGFINDDFPLHVAEATVSQSGKDYLQKMHSRIYNERPAGIAPPKGGVGSLDETISKVLIAGRPFVCFSNFRGKLESAILESAIRGQGRVECRALRTSATVDCTPFIWQLSTNGAEFTRDLANRSVITRIKKQPADYAFNRYPEGDLIAHVEANQYFYLGCVFAVIRAWVDSGKPRTTDTRHDFRQWTQSLDWIVQGIFDLPPLLDGHREEQARTANPALQWLRDLANAVIAEGHAGKTLTILELADVCVEASIDLPGRKDSPEEPKFRIGRTLAKLFKEAQTIDENTLQLKVDGIGVTRESSEEYNSDTRMTNTRHRHRFTRVEL